MEVRRDKTKKIAVLGVTGSIGSQTLDIVRRHPEDFCLTAVAADRNVDKTEEAVREFRPGIVCMYSEEAAKDLRARLADLPVTVLAGMDGLLAIAEEADYDIFLNAVSGMIGIRPTLAAIGRGRRIALANKETLVAAGHLVMAKVREHAKDGAEIIPVDSEHSAIFQCLKGEDPASVRRILLTCSGGIFRGRKREELLDATAADALVNPNWVMGRKITVDTATLVNKGLEVMEAGWLFGVPVRKIDVLVHPKSLCHSGVEFVDGAQILQTASPDMRLPIQYALFHPKRVPGPTPILDLTEKGPVAFLRPDTETFRGLPLAYRAAERGGTMPTVYNAADEEAVAQFLDGKIRFLDIYDRIEGAMEAHRAKPDPDLAEILEAEKEARESVRSFLR